MNKMFAIPLALVLTTPALVTTSMVAVAQVGTSCADCPNYSGAFSIENTSGVTIPYQVRWGNGAWKQISLRSGHTEIHSYPLGENRAGKAPPPHVRFDRIGGDGKFTAQEYHMKFHAVGYAGYGPSTNTTQPKRYYFEYAADGRTLNLFER